MQFEKRRLWGGEHLPAESWWVEEEKWLDSSWKHKSAAESNGSEGNWCWIVRKMTFIVRDHVLEHIGQRLCDPCPQKHPKPNCVRPHLVHKVQL